MGRGLGPWHCALGMTLWFSVWLQEKVEAQRQRFRLEFEKHRGYLAMEEQLQLRGLEEEERATLQRLRDSKSRLAQHNKALKELAEELEQRCRSPDLDLLEVRRVLVCGWRQARGTMLGSHDSWNSLCVTPPSGTFHVNLVGRC